MIHDDDPTVFSIGPTGGVSSKKRAPRGPEKTNPPRRRPVCAQASVGPPAPDRSHDVHSPPRGAGGGDANCAHRVASTDRKAKAGDGVVRVRRETAGRRGKTVTTITGVPGSSGTLRDLAGELKRLCGSGGTIKDAVIEIQGDHRERIAAHLESKGYRVKPAGG